MFPLSKIFGPLLVAAASVTAAPTTSTSSSPAAPRDQTFEGSYTGTVYKYDMNTGKHYGCSNNMGDEGFAFVSGELWNTTTSESTKCAYTIEVELQGPSWGIYYLSVGGFSDEVAGTDVLMTPGSFDHTADGAENDGTLPDAAYVLDPWFS